MFNIMIGGITCKIGLLFPAVLIVMLYCDPSGLVLIALAASLLHEAGHLAVLMIYRHPPQMLIFSFYGMKLIPQYHTPLSPMRMVTVLMAGPFMNGVCAALAILCCLDPMFYLVHIALLTLNLLPIIPLDGGQIFRIVLRSVCSHKQAFVIQQFFEYAVIAIMLFMGTAVWYCSKYNFTLLLITLYCILCKLFDNGN